jgi:hypothetical protein
MSKRNSKIPLSHSHPEILQFWDYEANPDIDPSKVVAGTPRKAQWICSLGHKFDSEIRAQASGLKCPVCSGRRVLPGFNDLATTHPELAKQWDRERNKKDPTEISAGAALKAFWLCDQGHSFQTQVAIRKKGIGCGFCANLKVWPGFNDIETRFPELVSEWDFSANGGLHPNQVLASGKKKHQWVCGSGHSFEQSMTSRAGGSGCPVCAGKLVQAGANDLASQFPEIAAEWDFEKNKPLRPSEVTSGSGRKVFWVCPMGHSYKSAVGSRKKSGCPVCAGQVVVAGVNDLATVRPELVGDWDFEANAPLSPQDVSAMSGRKVFWKCQRGHSWTVAINVRKGCPFCTGLRVIPGETDLGTQFPELAAEWDFSANNDLSPENVAPKTAKKVGWICAEGHKYEATVASRASGTGCPYCAGVRILKGFNDLASKRPDVAAQWDHDKNFPLKPDEVALHSTRSVHWICEKGHNFESIISYRIQGGCPFCGGKKVIQGHNDLATLSPQLASEWDFKRNGHTTPSDVTSHSGKKYFWLCEEGHSYESAVYARQNGNGCPECATSGYNPALPGLFYFIGNEGLRARKVGITNPGRKTNRITAYGPDWSVIQTLYSRDGSSIQSLETLTLRWLRKEKGLPPFLGRLEMGKNGGQSETFEAAGASDQEVLDKIEEISEQTGISSQPYDWVNRVEM